MNPHAAFVQTSRFGSVIFRTRGSSALPQTGQNLYGGVVVVRVHVAGPV